MNKRMYYSVRKGYTPMKQVLLVHSSGQDEVSVYCPSGVANGPWVEPFPTLDQAMDLASNLARETGQLQVKSTSDKIDWWLQGLELIGDADEKFRHETAAPRSGQV